VAFTLVEILIAFAILAILLVGIYEIMTNMMRSGTVTQWEQTLTVQFNNADSRIRDYLSGSSYPSLLSPQGNAVLKYAAPPGQPNTGFLLGFEPTLESAAGVAIPGDQTNTPVVSWYRCQDGRRGVEGLPDRPPRCTKIQLVAQGKRSTRGRVVRICDLVMVETPLPDLPSETDPFLAVTAAPGGNASAATTTKMVSDCSQIKAKLLNANPAVGVLSKDRVQLQIEIACTEPSQGQALRSRTITAEANVGAKAGAE
jgi:type II secretory pathway pseudopilin PulG